MAYPLSAMFCGKDIMFLVFHVISKDNVIKGSRAYIGKSYLKITQQYDHRRCGSVDILTILCQVILENYVTKGLNNFIGGSCSIKSTILPNFVALGNVLVDI